MPNRSKLIRTGAMQVASMTLQVPAAAVHGGSARGGGGGGGCVTWHWMVAAGAGLCATPVSLYSRPVPSGMGKNTDPSCCFSAVDMDSGLYVSV